VSIVATKVTLGTNTYVSAFQFGGMRLLHMAVDGHIEIAVSQPVLDELIRVLREKFQWDGYRLQAANSRSWGWPASWRRHRRST
jgi:hypothetical protein